MNPNPELNRPCERLYIYYLKGRLSSGQGCAASDFLGNWEEDGHSFLFFGKPARAAVEALVARAPQLELLDETDIDYEQWQGGRIAPLNVAGISIVSPWDPAPCRQPDSIVLDPGLVFGNGLHPTTRDCLEAIAMACRQGGIDSAVDLGTGTGLLALAAARCGAKRVLAVDLNMLCARTAEANIRRNGMEDRVLAIQGRAEEHAGMDADLMVANIHYDVMRHLIRNDDIAAKRHVVLSGLMRSEAKAVADRLAVLPLVIRRQWACDGIWHTFYAQRR